MPASARAPQGGDGKARAGEVGVDRLQAALVALMWFASSITRECEALVQQLLRA